NPVDHPHPHEAPRTDGVLSLGGSDRRILQACLRACLGLAAPSSPHGRPRGGHERSIARPYNRRMISTEAVQAALARAPRRGGDFADCFVEQRHAASVSMEDSRVERVQAGTEQGAGIRVVSGLTTAFAYTDDLSAPGLLRAADAAAAAARGG